MSQNIMKTKDVQCKTNEWKYDLLKDTTKAVCAYTRRRTDGSKAAWTE